MILRNLITTDDRSVDLYFRGENLSAGGELELELDGALVFPGLVNSHDHLDFNLFPQLGGAGFNNYTEWGHHIHRQYHREINEVLNIPLHLRALWGMYKNLICGVTTVVHHGNWLPVSRPLIRIYQEAQSLHSIGFEKYWKLRLNNPFRRNSLCVIHTAEGRDELAAKEADLLVQWNFLQRELVAIHGISMSPEQSQSFRALVWCPASNHFLFQQTAEIDQLQTKILFGTDSTLTASWNLWDHLYQARNMYGQSDENLLDMLTVNAGETWGLYGYQKGHLPSDLVVARKRKEQAFSSLTPADMLLVITGGRIRLIDEELMTQLRTQGRHLAGFCRMNVLGSTKMIEGNLPGLMSRIQFYAPHISFPVTEQKICSL